MGDVQQLSGALCVLSRTGLVEGDLDRMLDLLCDTALAVVPAAGAGVLLLDDQGRLQPVAVRPVESCDEVTWGVPMRAGTELVGRLEMYGGGQTDLPWQTLAVTQALADVAGAIVHQRRVHEAALRRAEQLEYALESRVLIEQAKGVLSVRLSLTPDEAFEHLRRYCRSHGQRLRAVARQVIAGEVPPDALRNGRAQKRSTRKPPQGSTAAAG